MKPARRAAQHPPAWRGVAYAPVVIGTERRCLFELDQAAAIAFVLCQCAIARARARASKPAPAEVR